jgi:hypothetical protein
MNYVQDEFRTRLALDKQEKCTFIFINSRTFWRIQAGHQIETTYTLTEEQEVCLDSRATISLLHEDQWQAGEDEGELWPESSGRPPARAFNTQDVLQGEETQEIAL